MSVRRGKYSIHTSKLLLFGVHYSIGTIYCNNETIERNLFTTTAMVVLINTKLVTIGYAKFKIEQCGQFL